MKILKKPDFSPFDHLLAWSELSHDTRLLFLTQIDSTLKVSDSVFSPKQITELIEAGFQFTNRPLLHPEVRPFRKLMRSMYRHPHFNLEAKLDLDYVTDHLINAESGGISLKHSFLFHKPAQYAKATAVESQWLNEFLHADSVTQWEGRHSDGQHRYLDETSAVLLKTWIERLINGRNPIPLSALLDNANGDHSTALTALRAGVRYLLLFPALDAETLDPIIGIWPAIHKRMNRKTATAPAPVDLPANCETYHLPILLHDMTTLLVATIGEGIRLKAQGDFFKKEEEALAQRLMPMPPPGCGYQPPHHGRLYEARNWLLHLKLVAPKGKPGKTLALKETPAGMRWLVGTEGERLNELVDALHQAHEKNMRGGWREHGEIAFIPNNPQNYSEKGKFNLEEKVVEVFRAYPVGDWISTRDFLQWQLETENPFLLSLDNTIERIFNRWNNSDTEREHLWKRVLQDFFQERLIPLGGIKSAFDTAGNHWFSITPVGAYLLGATDTFTYETETLSGDIIVQPNFEIIFTAANPFAEGELTRYADRIGHGIGTLFHITRESIHRALHSGMGSDQILENLQPLSEKKLPANVVAQIRDWGNTFRRVNIKNIVVIRCPDAEIALRVHALFPRRTEQITETILHIKSPQDLTPLKKKLLQNGIGIE